MAMKCSHFTLFFPHFAAWVNYLCSHAKVNYLRGGVGGRNHKCKSLWLHCKSGRYSGLSTRHFLCGEATLYSRSARAGGGDGASYTQVITQFAFHPFSRGFINSSLLLVSNLIVVCPGVPFLEGRGALYLSYLAMLQGIKPEPR